MEDVWVWSPSGDRWVSAAVSALNFDIWTVSVTFCPSTRENIHEVRRGCETRGPGSSSPLRLVHSDPVIPSPSHSNSGAAVITVLIWCMQSGSAWATGFSGPARKWSWDHVLFFFFSLSLTNDFFLAKGVQSCCRLHFCTANISA